ncbi:hypothetical protein CNMCM5878_000587 [Aspergillus fumigatiaffinis]|nr:hypothetical protein CNMCM5878_000587 [Aspergillus fumigatiaffinis]
MNDTLYLTSVPTSDLLAARDLAIRADSGGQSSLSTSSGDFTCGPDKPCANGACCGASGWCGYAPEYCGDGCQSNCNATAQCGHYAKDPGASCPLNVCCSQFGFCGTTSDFCGTGCQSDCDQPKPSVPKGNVRSRIVAYWESWNSNHACGTMAPDEIPVYDITHLVFAFGYIEPDDFKITLMDGVDAQLLDDYHDRLGWLDFTDPGKWQSVFTDMVATSGSRQKFIKNVLGFLAQYGFDGVDFDWEYPGADDRGGKQGDGENYTKLLQELRAAISAAGKDYLVTFTAPTSYWYLQHFDLENMSQYADWINLMAYDLHGVWDSNNPIGSTLLAHTNITEIDLALDLFWRSNVPPQDIVLGVAFYGRSLKLRDSSCWKPGCPFTVAGDEGDCTQTAGILSYKEIKDIIQSTNAKPYHDEDAAVNYLVYGQNNWVSYDDNNTFQAKIDFANKRGLSGLMIWAIDLDDPTRSALSALTGNTVEDANPLALADLAGSSTVGHSTSDSSQCRVTVCGGFCNQAETAVGRAKSLYGKDACSGDATNSRWVCCPAWTSITKDQCYWNAGGGAVKTDCSGQCKTGDIQMFSDSWGWKGDLRFGSYDYRCLRGGKVFCCNVGNMQQYLDICTWTECGGSCPSDKQNVLTIDSGGPKGAGKRCDDYDPNDIITNPAGYSDDDYDPKKGSKAHRKLCCPEKDSFKNCSWKSGKGCSQRCDNGQITLDLDPQGKGGRYCDNGRQKVFCCDAPGRANQPFLPVDFDKIFPPEYIPSADAQPQFELINFGGAAGIGDAHPDLTGVAFFLMAGSSTAVSSMSKRDNPGLHFLDCPKGILDAPVETVHTARVICVDRDVEECYQVQENGVEGTIVHMPRECGGGGYARAVSLQPSHNQSVPAHLALRNPTSVVYDFRFDYNMPLVRRDAGTISIRMDYSNVAGYWNAVVNSAGTTSGGTDSKRDLKGIVERFYSDNKDNWFAKFDALSPDTKGFSDLSSNITIDHLLFYNTEMCPTSDGQQGEGIAVTIEGALNAGFYYGFSMIATWDPSSTVKVHESAGFLNVDGSTSATFTVAGIGTLDSSKMNGETITKSSGKRTLAGHSLYHGWASFVGYMEQAVQLKTMGETSQAVSFNGYMESKAVAKWGMKGSVSNVHFPSAPSGITAPPLQVSQRNSMTPVGDNTPSSDIALALDITLGLKVTLAFSRPWSSAVDGRMPDMSVKQRLAAHFEFSGAGNEVCLKSTIYQTQYALLADGEYVGWGGNSLNQYITKGSQMDQQCFARSSNSLASRSNSDLLALENVRGHKKEGEEETDEEVEKEKRKKRQTNSTPRGDYNGFEGLPHLTDLINSEAAGSSRLSVPEINCNACGSCVISLNADNDCCDCAWLAPDDLNDGQWGYVSVSGLLGSSVYKRSIEGRFSELVARAGGISTGTKETTFWNPAVDPTHPDSSKAIVIESEPYPQYPDYWRNPQTTKNFDVSPYTGVKKYFHNSSDSCTSFDVAQFPSYDLMYPWPKPDNNGNAYKRGVGYHQLYQTEHVFEAQTIARFFMAWMPYHATKTRPALWSERYILQDIPTQPLNGQAWIHLMIDEIGSVDNQNRLTVFLTRPNSKKGKLFGGKASITQSRFDQDQKGGDQLLEAREVGMIFTYMNLDTVWESFCDTYNGALDVLRRFDSWYQSYTGAVSTLADEWPKFIRSELDMVVTQARSDLKMMNVKRKFAGAAYTQRWGTIMAVNGGEIQKVKLDRTDKCTNLPASTIGAFTG